MSRLTPPSMPPALFSLLLDASSAPLCDVLQAMSDSDLVSLGSQILALAREHPEMFSTPPSKDLLLELELGIQGFRAQQAYEVYQTRGDLNALEVCIQNWRHIMDMTEDDRPEKAATLMNLGVSLNARYKATGELRDLEESISLFQLANALTPDDSPTKPVRLQNLAVSLFSLFEREGRSEDLDEAIDLGTRAIKLVPDDHADKPTLLNNLGNSLHVRFKHSGTLDYLDKAISLQSRAVDLTPDGDPDKPMWSTNLGNSLQTRYEQLGALEDVEKAIKLHSRAVELTPDGHPSKAMCLNNTGNSLDARYDRLGNVDDLSQAIEFRSRAVDMSPDSHRLKLGWLNNLATSLQTRYERTGDARDLEQAIKHQTRAVILTPDGHPDKALMLNNLGNMLKTRFERSGSLEDLDAAVAHRRNAVTLTPEGHPDKQMWLYNLSNSLRERFDRVGDATDLAEAIRCSARSVELLPENHANRAGMLRLLGLLFLTRLRSPHAHADDATHAMEAFFTAMRHPTSPPPQRLRASDQYARLLTEFFHLLPPSPPLPLLEAYQHALDLIPQCIWLGNNVRGRYTSEELQTVTQVVSDAVAAAITAGEHGCALEWVETGRAVVWSQVLQLRTPIDDLQQRHPQLAENLAHISHALERAVSSSLPLPTVAQSGIRSFDNSDQSAHGYALEYNKLIAHIRELDGFENFLLPKALSQLSKACIAGPTVLINVHRSRCDALVLCRAGDVVHVPLPDLSLARADSLQTWLWDFLSRKSLLSRFRGGLRDEYEVGEREGRVTPRNALDTLRELLAALWNDIVKPIMDVISTLALPTSDGALPHVTWCPTGPLAFLPLHAAGIYPKDEYDRTPIQSIMDIAVSSYTPTLEALLKPRTKVAVNGEYPKTLVVSQPNTPGCSPIGGTSEEAGIIMSLLDPSATNCLDDTDGTVDAVLEGMETHSWVHLACHGIQDHADPLHSAFALYDGPLTLETLMTKHFPNAELAVLSACQTATGHEKLSEEAVHLAAGMLNIGYKSVIGTMWSIYDSSAPVVMGRFYEVMAEQAKAGGELQPAYALHEATKVLREKYGVSDFVRWMPFVHFGL